MKRRLTFTVSLSFLLMSFGCSSNHTSEKSSITADANLPNIVFILADDLGFGDLAVYGHPYAKTPYLDQLAKEGIMLKRAYAAGVSCAPSRAAFMTGRPPVVLRENFRESGFDDLTTITDLLNAKGYQTGHFGKWHIGERKNLSPEPYGIKTIGKEKGNREGAEGKDVDIFTEAIRFINANKDAPFYMNIWARATHYPIIDVSAFSAVFDSVKVIAEDFPISFKEEKIAKVSATELDVDSLMRCYLTEVYALDRQVGRVMNALEEAGLRENTILVFASDQGAAPIDLEIPENEYKRRQRYAMLGSAGNLRGGKHTTLEGGIRIPFIVRWPEKIPAGKVDSTSVFSAVDFLPTLCGINNIQYENLQLPGMDRSSVWLGELSKRETPLFWKMHSDKFAATVLDNDWKLIQDNHANKALYNVRTDPEEMVDLSNQYPEVLINLSQQIEDWEKSLNSQSF